ncbi:hypothetical protein BGW41_003473 [Actinomortierella wolfii]|nr:hypothetical protein BGW41_003473 [Actinomortierella wolfii]
MSYMGVHQILDCPELRKLITRYLRAGDIKVCVVVCKAWHGYFQGEVWKTLNLTEHRQQLWVSDEVVNAAAWFDSIRKNARWVRYLYYSYRLRPPQGLCDLLVETLRSLVYIEVLAKNEQEWAKFQQLILLNPAIRYIEVGVAHDHRDPYLLPIDLRLHSVITPMSTLLCSLVITTTTTVDQLLQILSVCPTLEELTVGHEFDHSRLVSHRPQQPEAPEAMVTKVADTDDDGTPPTAFSLKRLTVNSSSYDPALVNLMERCPALMHLGLNDLSDDVLIPLCNVLRSGCLPRLGSIMLISNARDSSRQLPLIIAIPPQQLQMADIWTNNALLYPTLVERHHQTLVSIQGCTVTGSDFRTVTPFFSRCRRLQKLNVHFIGEGELQVDIRYLLRVPWVCSEIEVLDMPIILDRECTEAVLLDIGLSEKAVKDPEKRSKWEQIEAVDYGVSLAFRDFSSSTLEANYVNSE